MVFRGRPSSSRSPQEPIPGERNALGVRYRMMQYPASMTGDSLIQTDEGTYAFKIESANRLMTDMRAFRDMKGDVRCLIPGPPATSAASAEVLGSDGRRLARVIRTPVTTARDRFEVDIAQDDFWAVIGDVGNREYTLESPRGQVAEVSRRWFLLPGTFGVEVSPGHDDALVLAVTTVIDEMAHELDG